MESIIALRTAACVGKWLVFWPNHMSFGVLNSRSKCWLRASKLLTRVRSVSLRHAPLLDHRAARGDAAVDRDDRSGDVAAARRGEEHHQVGDLFRARRAPAG